MWIILFILSKIRIKEPKKAMRRQEHRDGRGVLTQSNRANQVRRRLLCFLTGKSTPSHVHAIGRLTFQRCSGWPQHQHQHQHQIITNFLSLPTVGFFASRFNWNSWNFLSQQIQIWILETRRSRRKRSQLELLFEGISGREQCPIGSSRIVASMTRSCFWSAWESSPSSSWRYA